MRSDGVSLNGWQIEGRAVREFCLSGSASRIIALQRAAGRPEDANAVRL